MQIVMIDNTYKMFFSLIRVALGIQHSLGKSPSLKEWRDIFQLAKMQTVLGICFYGIQKLPREETLELKTDRLFTFWLGLVVQIEKRNEELNSRPLKSAILFNNQYISGNIAC